MNSASLCTRLLFFAALLAACTPQATLPTSTATILSENQSVGESTIQAATAVNEEQEPLMGLGWITFIANDGERQDVWLIRPDGSGEVNLTGRLPHVSADAPAWSPDGSLIAFDGLGVSGDEIFLVTVKDPPEQTQLTFRPGPDCYPNFSPDGTQIVYRSERENNSDLYAMSPNGEEIARLTDDPLADYEPAWSPDGSQIAFVSGRTGNSEIFVMDADGSNLRQLTDLVGLDWRPVWSPDGNWIAFESWRNGNGDLYLLAADGSQLQQLTDDPAEDGHPSFSPDGRYIAFHSRRNGDYQLFILELAHPENQWLLATTSSQALLPDWSKVLTLPNELPEN